MSSRRFPAARANQHTHFRKRNLEPLDNISLNIKRQDINPFDAFTAALLGPNNDNPRHKHRTSVIPNPLATVIQPPPIRPSPPKPSVVNPSLSIVSPTPATPQSPTTPVVPSISKQTAPVISSDSRTTSPLPSNSASQNAESASSSSTAKSSTPPSPGVVGGVVSAAVCVLVLGTIVWLLRKRMINRRTQSRTSWKAGLSKGWANEESALHTNLMSERASETPDFSKPLPKLNQGPKVAVDGRPEGLSLPPKTFNNPINTLEVALEVDSNGRSPSQTEEIALVKRGFIPSLPDELSINIGDAIYILSSYDDGWCLCRNNFGDRGMVPLECLNRKEPSKFELELGSQEEFTRRDARKNQARMSRRASSLYIGVSAQDGY